MARLCIAAAMVSVASCLQFGTDMAGNPLSGSGKLSLLQTGAKIDKEELPGMKLVLEKPDAVYKSMTQHVSSLGEQLEAVNAQGVDEAEQEKKEDDEQIKKLEKNNTHQMHENEKVERDIKLLDMTIASLRAKADLLMDQNKIVRADMKGVQDNIVLVQEFLLTSLEKSDENSSNTDDLIIIGELATADAAKKQELAHKKSLDIIAKKQDKKTVAAKTVKAVKRSKSSKLSLLQVGSAKKHGDIKKDKKDDKGASAHDLMAALASNLEQLMAEQAESQATIKASFEEESNALLAKHEELVEEWNTLNATRAAKTEVESRLKVAVSHLDKVHKSLSKRHVSLLNFGRKLANRPNPLADHKENLMQSSSIATNATVTNNTWQPLAWAEGLLR